ncbi:IclR family transcriptional regulator [Alkalihalobacillus sp. 1P02AB]|uniref:IclR family transcriptional regulator n=1 Tax=Alkalihalobacillus sp. 1P02AB TaxID=3132260 RepID=UPI0039A43F4C
MDDQYILKTLSNAIDVLSLFEHHISLTPKELEAKSNLNRTNLYRILYTLRHKGLLEIDSKSGEYKIGMQTINLASLALQRMDIKTICHPFLETLAVELNETIHLVVKNQNLATFIDKVESREDINMGSHIGWTAPLYSTASGKLLISQETDEVILKYWRETTHKSYTDHTIRSSERFIENIKEVRLNGFASDNEEMVEGLTCFAVPIKGHSDNIIASISASGATSRMKKNKEDVLYKLLQVSNEISKAIIKTPQGIF